MTTRTVSLAALAVAPENARFGKKPTHVDELAANIWRYGLLQPLVAYEGENRVWYVVDGARRLAALEKLHADGKTPAGIGAGAWDAIEIRVAAQEDALAHSLAANTQRVNLGMVEEAEQFSRMSTAGTSVEEIARVFGCTERHVQQRLKLASLYEPILRALEKGDINLDVAQAYAGATMERQAKVWKKLGAKGRTHQVKDALKQNTLLAGDALARFVGEEAYVAAGGMIESELFAAPDMSRWLDVPLAEKLADEKLRAAAEALQAEGFAFVEAAPEFRYGDFVEGAKGKARAPTAEEKRTLKALEKKIEAARKAMNKRRNELEEADVLWRDDFEIDEDEAFAAAQAERDAAIAERERLEAGLTEFDDKAKAKTGVVVTIDADGGLHVRRGVVRPKASSALKANGAGKGGARASVNPARKESSAPQPPMTNATHEKASLIASTIVGRAIAAQPKLAVTAIVASLARDTFGHSSEQALALDGRGYDRYTGVERPKLPGDDAHDAAEQAWAKKLGLTGPKQEDDELRLETIIAAWPFEEQLDLLAFCVGVRINARETDASKGYSDNPKDRRHQARWKLAQLGALAAVDPAAHFTPDAEFLNGMSRPLLDAAAEEMKIDTAGVKTKGALAALLADKAKEKRWTPPLIRTLCGVEIKPAAKTARNAVTVQGEARKGSKLAVKLDDTPLKLKKPAKKTPPKKAVKKLAKAPVRKTPAKARAKANGAAEARA